MQDVPNSHRPEQDADSSPRRVPELVSGQATGGERSPELARFWESLKRLPAYVRLSAAMAKDPEVPGAAKVLLGVGGAYVVSPVDLVPGVIPVAGQLDDLYVLLMAVRQAVKRTPDTVAARHLAAVGISRDDIDGDLKSVRDLVRVAVVKSVRFGGKVVGRVSRAAIRFADEQLRHQRAGRATRPPGAIPATGAGPASGSGAADAPTGAAGAPPAEEDA